MRRILAGVLALSLLCAAPRTAHAQEEIAEAIGLIFLFAIDTVASIGGTVTVIGSSVQASRPRPALGWSIASIVVGILAGLAGAITVAALVGSDLDRDAPGFWVFAAVPLALSAANLSVGVVNLTRAGNARARPDEEEWEEVEEEDEWSRGPAPGIGLSIAF
jgi:hypothetical protein